MISFDEELKPIDFAEVDLKLLKGFVQDGYCLDIFISGTDLFLFCVAGPQKIQIIRLDIKTPPSSILSQTVFDLDQTYDFRPVKGDISVQYGMHIDYISDNFYLNFWVHDKVGLSIISSNLKY
jgi:hypothetical protein